MRLLRSLSAGLLALVALKAEAGLHFQQVPGPNGADTNALAADGSTLWAGTLRGVWKLSDGAWTFDGLSDKTITSLAVAQGSVWAATGDGLWRRDTDGTWSVEALPKSPPLLTTVFSDGTTLWACGLGVYRRSGGTWTALASPGGPLTTATAATLFNGDLVVGRQGNAASRYSGSSIVPMTAGMGAGEGPNAFAVFGGSLWAGTSNGLYEWSGASWVYQLALGLHDVRAIADAGGTLRVATFDAGVLRQSGAAWIADNAGILFPSAKSFAALGADLFLGTTGSPVHRLGASTWIEAGTGLNAAIISDFFRSSEVGIHSFSWYVASRGAGLSLGDRPWPNLAPTGCGDVTAAALFGEGSHSLIASTNCGPLFVSASGGDSLTDAGPGLPAGTTLTTFSLPWAGTSNAGVFRFDGSSWISDQTAIPSNASAQNLRAVGGSLFAAAGRQVFALTGQPAEWKNISSGLDPSATVQAFGGTWSTPVFAGLVAGGIFRRDGDSPWRADLAGLNGTSVFSLDTVEPTNSWSLIPLQPTRLFAAAGRSGVQRKVAGGWLSDSSGLPPGVDARVVRGLLVGYEPTTVRNLLVGTAGHGVYSAPALTSMKVLPVVLDVVGATGARFRTELVIGNRHADPLSVEIVFTPAPGFGGPGTPLAKISKSIPAGGEIRVSDAIEFLRSEGLPVPPSGSGPVAGTLSLSWHPAWVNPYPDPINELLYAVARTTTSDANGTYGIAYDATSDLDAAEEEASVYGLRSTTGAARSNLAVVHLAGRTTDPITLSAHVFSADGAPAGAPLTKSLAPGEWFQWNGILGLAGLPDGSSGYVRINRVSGIGPWTAYGVVNDANTSDGSFLPFYRPGGLAAARRLVVPVVLDLYGLGGLHYTTELTLANDSAFATPVDLVYQPAPGFGTAGGVPVVTLALAAGAQTTIPDVIEYLRTNGVNIPDPAVAGSQAGTLTVTFRDLTNLNAPRTIALARTSTPNPNKTRGGSYGLFYPAAAKGGGARTSAVVPALIQDASTRSNLAVVHLGGGSESALTLSVQLHDAATGAAAGSPLSITLQPGDWYQWSRVLELAGAMAVTTKAVAVVTRVSGDDTWLVYGVLNDAKSSDGSYVSMIPAEEY